MIAWRISPPRSIPDESATNQTLIAVKKIKGLMMPDDPNGEEPNHIVVDHFKPICGNGEY